MRPSHLMLLLSCVLSTAVIEAKVKVPAHILKLLNLKPPSNEDIPVPPNVQDPLCPTCEPTAEVPCHERAKGCIVYNAWGQIQWYPDPCTLCNCYGCSNLKCPPLDCFGYPKVTKPGKCCSECDFGASKDNCSVIPVYTKSLYASLGDESCQSDVVIHDCNVKFGTDSDGQNFKCVAKEGYITHELRRECVRHTNIQQVVYSDVQECVREDIDLIPEEEPFLNQFPQDVFIGGDRNGLPPSCIDHFAKTKNNNPTVD